MEAIGTAQIIAAIGFVVVMAVVGVLGWIVHRDKSRHDDGSHTHS